MSKIVLHVCKMIFIHVVDLQQTPLCHRLKNNKLLPNASRSKDSVIIYEIF